MCISPRVWNDGCHFLEANSALGEKANGRGNGLSYPRAAEMLKGRASPVTKPGWPERPSRGRKRPWTGLWGGQSRMFRDIHRHVAVKGSPWKGCHCPSEGEASHTVWRRLAWNTQSLLTGMRFPRRSDWMGSGSVEIRVASEQGVRGCSVC